MKRLTLFAVLAATVLAWAAPSYSTGVRLLYAKTDSIWGRIGVNAGTTGNLVSEASKFRHWADSVDVSRYAGSCQRYWVEIIQLKNPNAAGGADTAAVFAVQLRSRDSHYSDNDSLVVDYARRKPYWVYSQPVTNPPMDTLTFQAPIAFGNDSTLAWCEAGGRTLAGGIATAYAGAISGHSGVRLEFKDELTGLPWQVARPEFKWRILANSTGTPHPKIAWYRIRIYCWDGS